MADIASITKTDALTMSSREIAELTGKRHDHVLRDIRKMFQDIEGASPNLGTPLEGYVQTWTDPQNGQEYEEYALPKNLTLNLVTGYRADMRLKIIDRWLELEGRPQPKYEIPQTLGEALRLAADTEEARSKAEAKVMELTPKAAALDRISTADGTHGLYEAAKVLQVAPRSLSSGWR